MEKRDVASVLRLILEISCILLVVLATPFLFFKIITFFLALFFVSVFVPRNEREKKGIHVRGMFKILTELAMVLVVLLISYKLYGKYVIVMLVISAVYLYLSKRRYSLLKNVE